MFVGVNSTDQFNIWSRFVLIDWLVVLGQVLKVLEGHTSSVYSVAISTDGSKIVSGSDDKTVRIWSAETGEVPACLPAPIPTTRIVERIFVWLAVIIGAG